VLSQTRPNPDRAGATLRRPDIDEETFMTSIPPEQQPYEQPPWAPPPQPYSPVPPAPVPPGEYPTGPVYAAAAPQPGRRRTKPIVLSILGGALVLSLLLCVIGAIASGGDGGQDPAGNAGAAATTGRPADPTTATQQPAAAAPSKPAPTTKKPAPPPAPTWKTVVTLKGSSNKRSAAFHLGGGQTRLTYQIKGGDFATALIYVVEKGSSLERDGGIPEVMPDGPGKDSTELAKDEGDYYLDVKAANCTWTVTIQEKR
jgi:hypothetical protein